MHKSQSSRNVSVAYSLHSKLVFKVIVVGDQGVGKTSLVLRYVKGIFEKNYKVTVGVEFYSKQIALQIWDTAGQQYFKAIARSFYNLASCVIIAYNNPQDLETKIEKWIYQINQYANSAVRIVLVRTKIDEIPLEQNQIRQTKEIVEKYQMDLFMGLSSKNGININQFFQEIALKMHELYISNSDFRELVDPKKNSFVISNENKQISSQRKKCC